MRNKDFITRKLNSDYAPEIFGSKTLYDDVFKPLIDAKEIDFFFEIFKSPEIELRAWGFLGIYHYFKEKIRADIRNDSLLIQLHTTIKQVLNDYQKIAYISCNERILTSLRNHHFKRITWLDSSLTFEPVMEYCKGFDKEIDQVIIGLIEGILSKVQDPNVEPLLISYADKIKINDFDNKIGLVKSFENLAKHSELMDISSIQNVFQKYLKELEELSADKKSKILKENLLRIAAVLNLDFEDATMNYIESLVYPYSGLFEIAKKYQKNKRFQSIVLNLMQRSNNAYLIADICRALLIIQDEIPNWKELIIDNVKKFELIDEDLVYDMQKFNLVKEEMAISFLIKGAPWQLTFLHSFLMNYPEKLDEWASFRSKFIDILEKFDDSEAALYDRKEFAFKIIIDLERKDMSKFCLCNFENLKDDQLRKMCLFVLITYGNDNIWIELRKIMNKDEQTSLYVKRFWSNLERNEWKFFY
ncbi:MAG: hypothetical protein ACTSR8_08585 [Promethearchaeota archaeon]